MNSWRYTDLKCRECGGIVVQDIWKLEYYCLECGLIHEGVSDEDNPNKRHQDSNERQEHIQYPITYRNLQRHK